MRLVKTNSLAPSPCLYLFTTKSYGQKTYIIMTHCDVIRPEYVLLITFDRKELETWGRSQFVCLDETHALICNMTYLGHFRDLTWGQISKLSFRGHVMIKIGHVAYVSMRLDETDSVIPFPRLKIHFLKVTLQKTLISPWPLHVT